MLEVFFNDSAKYSMQMSKKSKNPEALISLDYHLDIGDISNGIDGPGRKEVFNQLFNRTDLAIQRQNLEKVIAATTAGEPVRVWKSNAPFSACGFAFLCNELREIDSEITVVTLPEYVTSTADKIVYYNNWGEVSSTEFELFLSFEEKLTTVEKKIQANRWQELKLENSSLRAIVNGKLLSVPESFYDHLILTHLPHEEFIVEDLVAHILGEYPIGVSDAWYMHRIMQLK